MSSFGVLAVAAVAAMMLCAVPSGSATAPVISVTEFGAVGDGRADDTGAFQKALEKARETGARVTVPKGKYKITSILELKAQSLVGEVAGAWGADEISLPEIIIPGKVGGFKLLAGGSIHGLQITHDWLGVEPEPRAPTIELAGVGCRVSDVKIFGAWDAIWADPNTNPARSLINNIFIVECHNVGVGMAGTYDCTWIQNVEVWSPASKNFERKGVGFLLGKNDMLLVSNCFAFRAHVGFKLTDEYPEFDKKEGMWGTFTNCNTDFCAVGVEVNGKHTISLAGGTFWTHWHAMLVKGEESQVRVSGVEFASNGGPALWIDGGKYFACSGAQIRRTAQGFDHPAVRISGGDAVAISGCVIASSTNGVEVKEGMENVVLSGNAMKENVEE